MNATALAIALVIDPEAASRPPAPPRAAAAFEAPAPVPPPPLAPGRCAARAPARAARRRVARLRLACRRRPRTPVTLSGRAQVVAGLVPATSPGFELSFSARPGRRWGYAFAASLARSQDGDSRHWLARRGTEPSERSRHVRRRWLAKGPLAVCRRADARSVSRRRSRSCSCHGRRRLLVSGNRAGCRSASCCNRWIFFELGARDSCRSDARSSWCVARVSRSGANRFFQASVSLGSGRCFHEGPPRLGGLSGCGAGH